MYLWGAHTLTTVVHLCINISLCLCDTVRRQHVCAVQHNRHAKCRKWWTENIWHASVCSVAHKDEAVERSTAPIWICSKCCSLHTPWQHTWKYQISYNGYCNCFGIYSFFTYSEVLSKLTTSTELLFRLSNIIHSNCQDHFCCSQNARISVHGIIFSIAWPVDRTACRTQLRWPVYLSFLLSLWRNLSVTLSHLSIFFTESWMPWLVCGGIKGNFMISFVVT